MDFLGLSIHNVLDKSLQGLQHQQKVIQQNLSNVDTVGYKRKKYDFDKYMNYEENKVKSRRLYTTHKKHFKIMNIKVNKQRKFLDYDKNPTLWQDNTGNNVSLDKENIEMSKNHIHSNTVINTFQKYSSTYKAALATLAK